MSAASPLTEGPDESSTNMNTDIIVKENLSSKNEFQSSDAITIVTQPQVRKDSLDTFEKKEEESTLNETQTEQSTTQSSDSQALQNYEPANEGSSQIHKIEASEQKSESEKDLKQTNSNIPIPSVEHDQTDEPEPDSPSSTSSTSISHLSLSERFAQACREVPPPKWNPSNHEAATPAERTFLVENSSGILLLSPQASKQPCDSSRNAARIAIAAAAPPNTSRSVPNLTRNESLSKRENKFKLPLLSETPPSVYKALRTFEWEGSTSQKILAEYHEKVIAKQKEKAEAEGDEAKKLDTTTTTTENNTTKPSESTIDSVLWAAQETSAGISLLREIRAAARAKKPAPRSPLDGSVVWSLLASKAGRLKPEAAAEMARARVAAAAAAKVMRESEEAEPVPQRTPPKTAMQHHDAEDLLMLKSFRRTLSMDSSPATLVKKERKRVAFAPGTVFEKKRTGQ